MHIDTMISPQTSASVYECTHFIGAYNRLSVEVLATWFMAPSCTRCRLFVQVKSPPLEVSEPYGVS
jgi:hypothetical protein